jgi:hypothetical protein
MERVKIPTYILTFTTNDFKSNHHYHSYQRKYNNCLFYHKDDFLHIYLLLTNCKYILTKEHINLNISEHYNPPSLTGSHHLTAQYSN